MKDRADNEADSWCPPFDYVASAFALSPGTARTGDDGAVTHALRSVSERVLDQVGELAACPTSFRRPVRDTPPVHRKRWSAVSVGAAVPSLWGI
jgi:hypothetical protein